MRRHWRTTSKPITLDSVSFWVLNQDPGDCSCHNFCRLLLGESCLPHGRAVLAAAPNDPSAFNNMGNVSMAMGAALTVFPLLSRVFSVLPKVSNDHWSGQVTASRCVLGSSRE